jgi:hypothetical protein
MMVAMMCRPPQRTALSRRSADHGENKLRESRCLERPMREVAMINARDGKHPDQVKRDCGSNRGPTPTNDKDPQATEVKDDEGQTTEPVYTVNVADFRRGAGSMKVGIKPLNERRSYRILV